MCVASLLVRMFVIGYTPRVRHQQLPQCFPIPQTEKNPFVSSFHTPFPLCMPRDTSVAAGSSFPPDKNKHRRSKRKAAVVHPVPGFFSWWPLQQCQPEMHSQLHRRYPKSQQPTDFPDDGRLPVPASAAPLPHLPRHLFTYLVTLYSARLQHLMLGSWKMTHDIHHLAALSQEVTVS